MPAAADLIAALRHHHTPPPSKPIGGKLLVEVQSPTGGRRADALWLPVNTASRGRLVGYEVKVSRSDVLQELRDPMKADAWEQHCSQWWLVVPDATLVVGLDVPERWGIMTPPRNPKGRSMQVVRPAAVRRDVTPSAAAWGEVMAKLVYGGDDVQATVTRLQNEAKYDRNRLEQVLEQNRELRAAGALLRGEEAELQRKVAEVFTALGKLTDDGQPLEHVWAWNISPEVVATQILANKSMEQSLQRMASEAQHMSERAAKLEVAAAALREAAAGVKQDRF